MSTDWTGLPPVVYAGIFYLAVFTTAGTFFRVQFAAMRLPSGKIMAYVYLLPALVIVQEGLLGHGWVAPRVLPGIAAIIAALLILSHNEDEEISKDWAAAGANVLFHAVVETAEIVELGNARGDTS